MSKNIIMKQYNGSSYDELYPKTLASQVQTTSISGINNVESALNNLNSGTFFNNYQTKIGNVFEDWSDQLVPTPFASYICNAYGNGIAIATETNYVIISNDNGRTWQRQNLPENSGYPIGACFGNNKFIIVTQNSNVLYSSNGINWTVSSTFPSTIQSVNGDIIFDGSRFILVGSSGSPYYTPNGAYSFDGINWNTFTPPLPTNHYNYPGIVYGNGVYIIPCLANDQAREFYFLKSTNLTNWTQISVSSIGKKSWKGCAYGNGVFVITATDMDKALCTTDGGNNWYLSSLPYSSPCLVKFGNGKFLLVTSYGWICTSQNGVSWETAEQGISSPSSILHFTGAAGIFHSNAILYTSDLYANSQYLKDINNNKLLTGNSQFGSYIGTGTYGSQNPNSITLDFSPRILFIFKSNGGLYPNSSGWSSSAVWILGTKRGYVNTGTMYYNLNGNILSFYASGAAEQLNNQGEKYLYLAMC